MTLFINAILYYYGQSLINRLLNLRPNDLGSSWNQIDLKCHSKIFKT